MYVIEVASQKLARKIQHQRLAEAELSFVGDRDVFFIILDVIGQLIVQFIVQFIQLETFGTPIDFACPPAQEGVMLAEVAASDEFEREEYVRKAGRHLATVIRTTCVMEDALLPQSSSRARSRNTISVVPAKAGTHNHQYLLLHSMAAPAFVQRTPVAMGLGSRPGRRFILTSPPVMRLGG
jgi:hypothetical protein